MAIIIYIVLGLVTIEAVAPAKSGGLGRLVATIKNLFEKASYINCLPNSSKLAVINLLTSNDWFTQVIQFRHQEGTRSVIPTSVAKGLFRGQMSTMEFKKYNTLDVFLREFRGIVAKIRSLKDGDLTKIRRFTRNRTNSGWRYAYQLTGTTNKQMIKLVLDDSNNPATVATGRVHQLKAELRQYNTQVADFNKVLENSFEGVAVDLDQLKNLNDDLKTKYDDLNSKWSFERLFERTHFGLRLSSEDSSRQQKQILKFCLDCSSRIKVKNKERPMTAEELKAEIEFKKKADEEASRKRSDCSYGTFCNRCDSPRVSGGTLMVHIVQTCLCGSKTSPEMPDRSESWACDSLFWWK